MLAIPFILFIGIILGYFFSKNINLTYYALGVSIVFIIYFVISNLVRSITTSNEILVRWNYV